MHHCETQTQTAYVLGRKKRALTTAHQPKHDSSYVQNARCEIFSYSFYTD